MLERLIESWLDSTSERSYQTPFCQMLSAQGHKIVHSTRHTPIEYGKDIITINPQGIPYIYQLKGNPGSRVTLSQFKRDQPQLVQMATQPIVFPGVPKKTPRCFYVTNGLIDEEVQRAVDDLNRNYAGQGINIEILQRGQLLDFAKELGASLWPNELEDVNALLDMLVTRGDDFFPIEKFHHLITKVLYLEEYQRSKVTTTEIKRRITSAGIITAVALRNFSAKENHLATVTAWVLYSTYVIATCEKYGCNFQRNGKASVEIAQVGIFNALGGLCDELISRSVYIEGNPLQDFLVHPARLTLLVALMSVYFFWCEVEGWPSKEHHNFVEEFLNKDKVKMALWGEGAIPQILIHLFYFRTRSSTTDFDLRLVELLRTLIALNTRDNTQPLASPYYTLEEIHRHNMAEVLRGKGDVIKDESFRRTAYHAEGLLHLVVRTNLKRTCKKLWPDFSKLNLREFRPENSWNFCVWRTEKGEEISRIPPMEEHWDNLVKKACEISAPEVPAALQQRKFLLMLFVIILPYRGTPSVIRFLGDQFNTYWSI